jgi:hypothetical protein
MLQEISSILEEQNQGHFETHVLKGRHEFMKLGKLEGRHHFISPLDEAISSPFRIRRMQYAESDSSKNRKWSDLYNTVINAGFNYICEILDQDDADQWAITARNQANQIISAKGPIGFFERNTGFCWINSNQKEGEVQYTEDLIFKIGDTEYPIATRETRSKVIDKYVDDDIEPEGYQNFVAKEEKLIPLLNALQLFNSNWRHIENRSHHHLYVWSDSEVCTFQPSFVKELIRWYLNFSLMDNNHSAHILILCSVGPDSELNLCLDDIEKLAIQRVRPGGKILIAPGESNVGDQLTKRRIAEIGFDQRIFNSTYYEQAKHEPTIDIVEKTAIGILSPCWSGTWKESKEVDGEQVMTSNHP